MPGQGQLAPPLNIARRRLVGSAPSVDPNPNPAFTIHENTVSGTAALPVITGRRAFYTTTHRLWPPLDPTAREGLPGHVRLAVRPRMQPMQLLEALISLRRLISSSCKTPPACFSINTVPHTSDPHVACRP